MEEYISKSALVAEIERRYETNLIGARSAFRNGKIEVLREVKEFVNTLEVKEVQEEPVSEDRKETILKKAHELANKAERISGVFPKSTLIAVACDMAEWCDTHPIEEPVCEDLEEAAIKSSTEAFFVAPQWTGVGIELFKAGAQWQFAQLENNRLAACDRQTKEEAEREQDFVDKVLLGEQRQPTYSDAIEYGIQWQKQQTIDKACEWLTANLANYFGHDSAYSYIEDFRKALEEG